MARTIRMATVGGPPVILSPETFNSLAEVSNARVQSSHRGPTGPLRHTEREIRDSDTVKIENTTASGLDQYAVLGISGPLFTPRTRNQSPPNDLVDYPHVRNRVLLKGRTPLAGDVGRFAILQEPAAAGRIARAIVGGLTWCKVEMVSESHQFAEAVAGDATKLRSGDAGMATLLWVEDPNDREPTEDDPDAKIAWCVVRLGAGGGAAAVAAAFAQITSRSGTMPPYRYSAQQATMDIDGAWSAVGGGVVYNNVFNLEEQGAGGQWVNPLVNGDVVVIYPGPDPNVDAWVCARSHYRGTY